MSTVANITSHPTLDPLPWRNLRAVVLLAGAVRQNRLDSLVGRPLFDLPLEKDRSILDDWRRQVQRLIEVRGRGPLPVRILMNRSVSHMPPGPAEAAAGKSGGGMEVERDPFDYRGAGGVLRDLSMDYKEEDYLLVASAAQVLMQPLEELAHSMAAMGGDVTIISHEDGTPSGLSLIRCGALRQLPASGFVDFKEQALPAIAGKYRVHVLELGQPSGLPVRTLAGYIAALRRHYQQQSGMSHEDDPFAEGWESAFSIVEAGAQVEASAQLSDSVVLRGARVEAAAVLARSLVCPGGVVGRQQVAVDAAVTAAGTGTGGYKA